MGQSATKSTRIDDIPSDQREAVLNGQVDLKGVAERIASGKCNNIVVLCGAGISVAAGIPDFRSPGSGLYHNLQKYDLPRPEAVFDIGFFNENPKPFFALAKEIWPQHLTPTRTHYFFKLLHDKGLLRRVYTQNIDTLERVAGLPGDKLVEAHGSFHTAACLDCKTRHEKEYVKAAVLKDEIPHCRECNGIVKPCITFFGESLPPRFGKLVGTDTTKCDLLFVIGTSLQVGPVNAIPDMVSHLCPRVMFNRDMVFAMEPEKSDDEDSDDDGVANSAFAALMGATQATFRFQRKDNYRDVFSGGDCDDSVGALADALGWRAELDALVEAGQGAATTAAAVADTTTGAAGAGGGAGAAAGGGAVAAAAAATSTADGSTGEVAAASGVTSAPDAAPAPASDQAKDGETAPAPTAPTSPTVAPAPASSDSAANL